VEVDARDLERLGPVDEHIELAFVLDLQDYEVVRAPKPLEVQLRLTRGELAHGMARLCNL
jgi:hypothetical protein